VSSEAKRLDADAKREKNWKRWGPYLSERQWGTVREDYSPDGDCWNSFPHDHARSRAYRWGEDGLLGITDRECRLCFALALWNGKDPILKERLFGLTSFEGNHGEDVKECYYYLDSTPTHSYAKALYKYPQAAYPYDRIVEENRRRGKHEPEYELVDTGVFDGDRYFDVIAEYAKAAENDILVRITVANRGPDEATLHVLPTLWARNTWSWGGKGEGHWVKPRLALTPDGAVHADHASLGTYRLDFGEAAGGRAPFVLFSENETNTRRHYGTEPSTPYVKDAFHEYVVHGNRDAVNPESHGTKAAPLYIVDVPAHGEIVLKLRLAEEPAARAEGFALGSGFDAVFAERIREADEFYDALLPRSATADERSVMRQAYAGLLWSKQVYHYIVKDWLEGDPEQPPPPVERTYGRNADWKHLYNRDVISMPDAWEYPWYAAWDLAFHMIPFARLDAGFAKEQLVLLLREWYMHPNGQLPAYEFAFSDVNPPVHAWAAWRVYKMTGARGSRDRVFLSRVFQKLIINFTWWVNRKDSDGNHLFSGGFLGLDNIGVFDRSKPLPTGGSLEQADGTAWMAFYATTMMSIALELSRDNPATEDVASKFFEHFVAIADAMNTLGGSGLWDEEDGFYYDQLHVDGHSSPLKVRSLVGAIPLIAVEVLDSGQVDKLPGFKKRMSWFLENRKDLARQLSFMEKGRDVKTLLALPTRDRLVRVLRYLLDENEFLSPYGLRSISRVHKDRPYVLAVNGEEFRVDYDPAESTTGLFGGNSNWRGPIWFPINFLIVEALERYHHFYGDSLKVACPTGSENLMTLREVARELSSRLAKIFLADGSGRRPVHADDARYKDDPHWKELVLFYEYFHGETGRGVGASHQTGWTATVAKFVEDLAKTRESGYSFAPVTFRDGVKGK
jgi:mannosylglycerate hydrolase MGH1-like protein